MDDIGTDLYLAYENGYEAGKKDATQKWISVKERLPEHSGPYLVWMLWEFDECRVHSIINFDADCGAFGEWDDFYDPGSLGWAGSDFHEIANVFAWMPLPEPPKEGGSE